MAGTRERCVEIDPVGLGRLSGNPCRFACPLKTADDDRPGVGSFGEDAFQRREGALPCFPVSFGRPDTADVGFEEIVRIDDGAS